MSEKQYCRGEARYVPTVEVAYSAEAGEAVHTPADGSAPHNLMGMHLPSEMLQQGMEDADAAWREYRESQSQGPDGRLTFSHREPFIAGYLAALPEDQG